MLYSSDVLIPVNNAYLKGKLTIPELSSPIIIFSHGSGSSRNSLRNISMAEYLNNNHFGTLLFDLLTEDESRAFHNRFDIDLLTERLIAVTHWLKEQPISKKSKMAYFGASTGAASALRAASKIKDISAVVCRGGRPDLVMIDLPKVDSPTLLIIGGLDEEVIELNVEAYRELQCIKKMKIVDGASHLFEEFGKMDIVKKIATEWFVKYLLPVSILV